MNVTPFSALVQWAGIAAPIMYTGMGVQDSVTCNRPTSLHIPGKVMAKQWVHMYQFGPVWVRPVIALGTISNAYLAWASPSSSQRALYIAAAGLIGSILPITFAYFEPGINGAGKWKVQSMLRAEGFSLPLGNGVPSVYRHSATEQAKLWAESTDMASLVASWSRRNNGRWIITIVAALLSGYATLYM